MLFELCCFFVILWLLLKIWNWNFTYWKDRGFPYIEAKFPFGNASGLIFMNEFQGQVAKDIYDKMGDQPYVGIVMGRRPHLLLKDPEIIKCVMQKDFNHFTDRIQVDMIKEPITEHLFSLGGAKWRAFRIKLTPTFSSGKLKLMFKLFQECALGLESVLEATSGKEVDIKDLMARFTTDVIGSCAFGLDIKSLDNPDSEFRKVAKIFFPSIVPTSRKVKNFINSVVPGLEKIYRFQIISEKVDRFLTSVVLDTMKYRETSNFKRNDFIDLLLEIKNKGSISTDKGESKDDNNIEIQDGDLVAQVFVFFAAGFETSSSVTSSCLYELAVNPDIQDRLRSEILHVTSKHEGVTYQAIQEMHYLDQVVSETMRKYPTIPILSRKCTRNYNMPDRKELVLEKDIRVLIPSFALHRDPKYFPDPDRFDPERFSPENKNSIPQFTYLPFGEGPRNCIGLRFGLLQVKMGLITCLSKFEFCRTKNTVVPMVLAPSSLITIVKHPISLMVKKIS